MHPQPDDEIPFGSEYPPAGSEYEYLPADSGFPGEQAEPASEYGTEQPSAETGFPAAQGDDGVEGELPEEPEPRFGEESWKEAPVYDEEGNHIGNTSVETEY
jgi:hypothetical protein